MKCISLLVLSLVIPPLVHGQALVPVTRVQLHMGTLCEIEAHGPDQKKTNQAVSAAFNEIKRLDSLFSTYKVTSETTHMNKTAHKAPQFCSKDMWALLELSNQLWKKTNGAFDPTLGHWNNVTLNPSQQTIQFKTAQVKLDFGGIAKGYALDQGIRVLKKFGVEKALLNFGGQIATYGDHWPVQLSGAHNPNKIVGEFHLRDASAASSSQLQKTHIINPQSKTLASASGHVTFIAKSAAEADALATALFIEQSKLTSFQFSKSDCAFLIKPTKNKDVISHAGNCIPYL